MTEAQVHTTRQDRVRDRAGRPSPGDLARQQLLAQMPATQRRLTLAGISTAVLEGGNGPPIVLLHGPAANATHWMRVTPGLVEARHVIVPDLPGHGASGLPSGGQIGADHVIAWLGALIEQCCRVPPVLMGQLLGGAIAARFASVQGHRLSQLVLVDTFGLRRFHPAPDFALALTNYLTQPGERTHTDLWHHCAFNLGTRAVAAVRGLQRRSCPHAKSAGRRGHPHGAIRCACDSGRRSRAHNRSDHPGLGAPRPRDPACRRRGGERAFRVAAARDRGLQRRSSR
jgi:pimeloyl-ACP methyl ester carboxylesterase